MHSHRDRLARMAIYNLDRYLAAGGMPARGRQSDERCGTESEERQSEVVAGGRH